MTLDDLRELISINFDACRETLDYISDLRSRLQSAEPDVHALAAFGAYLHALYGGVENTLKQMVIHLGGELPSGSDWHSKLLDLCTQSTGDARFDCVPVPLRARLNEYRGFRHVFRAHYPMDLQWTKVKPLLDDAAETFTSFYGSVFGFLDHAPG